MKFAYPSQKLQDWITQQWVIIRGRQIDPTNYSWLMGPFGNLDGIGESFIYQLAEKENLIVQRDARDKGLIPDFKVLKLSQTDFEKLSTEVINFYEKTSSHKLKFAVKWNPFFKFFGLLLNKLFSERINQLNIPYQNIDNPEDILSEVITLCDTVSNEVKYTFWYRAIKNTGQVVYSGIYGVCTLPSGDVCVKAAFPLPNGNATVIMKVAVDEQDSLALNASGKHFGDAGFYFLLKDSTNNYWAQYIRSFRDQLIVKKENEGLSAIQTLTLWHLKVLKFNYRIK